MYPQADVPVVQLSIQSPLGPAHHIRLGRELMTLRKEVLVLASGSFHHNLRTDEPRRLDAREPACGRRSFPTGFMLHWSRDEPTTLVAIAGSRLTAALAHPEEDHFLPLFVALGAGGEVP
jgi:4,5-DOPA dioxygenase extradiol